MFIELNQLLASHSVLRPQTSVLYFFISPLRFALCTVSFHLPNSHFRLLMARFLRRPAAIAGVNDDTHAPQQIIGFFLLGIAPFPGHGNDRLNDFIAQSGLLQFDHVLHRRKTNRARAVPINDRLRISKKRTFFNQHLEGRFTDPGFLHGHNISDTEGRRLDHLFSGNYCNSLIADAGLLQLNDAFATKCRCRLDGKDYQKYQKSVDDQFFKHGVALSQKIHQTGLDDSGRRRQCGFIGNFQVGQFHNRLGNIRLFGICQGPLHLGL